MILMQAAFGEHKLRIQILYLEVTKMHTSLYIVLCAFVCYLNVYSQMC